MLNQYYQFAAAPLPQDIWAEIARYLDAKDVEVLRLVCVQFNTQMGQNAIWQPLLNRLHAIDPRIKTIPLPNQSCREAFIQGFNKIKNRQIIELSYIKRRIDFFHIEAIAGNNDSDVDKANTNEFIEQVKQIINNLDSAKLLELESNHVLLNKINHDNIEYSMFFSEYYSASFEGLIVEATRLPKSLFQGMGYLSFWKNLKVLQVEGIVNYIPEEIGFCESIEAIILQGNNIVKLPDNIGQLTTLFRLDLSNNNLTTLPSSIGALTSLKHLYLQRNRIESLPESVAKLSNLKTLLLDSNLRHLIPEELLNIELDGDSEEAFSELSEDENEDTIIVTMEDLYEELNNDGYFGDDEKMENELVPAKRPKK